VAALLRRVAATAGVHMYEMELFDDFEYVCHVWIGQALESLLGGVPEGMDKEAAWEACIHPDDRATYEAGFAPLNNGDATETEYRLVGFDGATRWVWERCIPRPVVDGRRLVDGIVTDITDRHLVERELAEAHARLAHTGLPRPPHRAAQPRAVPGASRRRAGPRRPRRLLRGRAVHRPGRVQAGERCPWTRRR
jgi:hypothetical protein